MFHWCRPLITFFFRKLPNLAKFPVLHVAFSPKLFSDSGTDSAALCPFGKHRCCIEVYKWLLQPVNCIVYSPHHHIHPDVSSLSLTAVLTNASFFLTVTLFWSNSDCIRSFWVRVPPFLKKKNQKPGRLITWSLTVHSADVFRSRLHFLFLLNNKWQPGMQKLLMENDMLLRKKTTNKSCETS